jgi:hypothetical protein
MLVKRYSVVLDKPFLTTVTLMWNT